MAVSLSASAAPSLITPERITSSAYSPKLSPLSSTARFPLQIRWSKRISLPLRRRHAPLAFAAKKQTYNSFDDLLANCDKPVLVDFYATWCGPCQFMVPVLNEVSAALKDKIQLVKIDTEKYPSIASRYMIEALPTFIIFKDGKPCDRFEGALSANQLVERIENSLKVKQ